MTATDPLTLADDTVLLHIGPHKTGTTTLQGALSGNREALAAHGVHYAGQGRQARAAASAVVMSNPPPALQARAQRRWRRLVKEVRRATASRVLVSSETFSNADDAAIGTVLDAFGRDRTHVVVTVRPLARILPSQWQQQVQRGLTDSYGSWLEQVLRGDVAPTRATRMFRRRHRHDELAARWAAVAGTDNVTVVVLDDADRGMLLDTFERLLGLPSGLLVPDGRSNPSLSLTEAELYREVNRQFFAEKQWSPMLHDRVVRPAIAAYLKKQPALASDRPIVTPSWALERADEIAREMITALDDSGVQIIGELQNMRSASSGAPETISDLAEVPVEVAARAAMGVVRHTRIDPRTATRSSSPTGTPAPAAPAPATSATPSAPKGTSAARAAAASEVSSGDLLRVVAGRAKRRLRPRSPARPGRT